MRNPTTGIVSNSSDSPVLEGFLRLPPFFKSRWRLGLRLMGSVNDNAAAIPETIDENPRYHNLFIPVPVKIKFYLCKIPFLRALF
jgi:hypothetical protein